MRFRNVVYCLSLVVKDHDNILQNFPIKKHLSGLGLSDDECYSKYLKKIFSYTNTFFHTDPKLDITSIPNNLESSLDFLISSDVFEHVVPPVSKAFINSFKMLKNGGWLILTVPHFDAESKEHYPNLNDFEIIDFRGSRILLNRTKDGKLEAFDGLVFHGGAGKTLEMRSFSRIQLLNELKDAGFVNIRIVNEDVPEYGIIHPNSDGCPILAQKPS